MAKAYLIFGIVVCVALAYVNHTGWVVWNSIASGTWGPQGQNVYHK